MHRSLFEKVKILHRDILENNIIITDPEMADDFTGMLIDLDLAIDDGKRTGARQMTGTMEFMASMYFTQSRAYLQAWSGLVFLRTIVDVRSSRVGKRVPMQHKRPAQEEYFEEVVRDQCCRCRRHEAMEYAHGWGLKVCWMSLCRHFDCIKAPV